MDEKSNNGLSSHMSIFDESINDEENVNNENENKNKNNIVIEIKEEKILKFNEQFLAKKRKSLSEEEKKERIEKRKNSYCKLNDEIILLFEKINNDEITTKNIIQMWNLLVKDLSDTKKITNWEALFFNKKKKIIYRLFNLTRENGQEFWYKLTDGRTKNGYAQDINSNNISKANKILKLLEEKKNEKINKNDGEEKKKEDILNINSKKNKTIKELIQAAELRDKEIEKINEEILGIDNDISSDESELVDNDSSNIDDNNIDIKNEEKEEKERKEKKRKRKKGRRKKIKKKY